MSVFAVSHSWYLFLGTYAVADRNGAVHEFEDEQKFILFAIALSIDASSLSDSLSVSLLDVDFSFVTTRWEESLIIYAADCVVDIPLLKL